MTVLEGGNMAEWERGRDLRGLPEDEVETRAA